MYTTQQFIDQIIPQLKILMGSNLVEVELTDEDYTTVINMAMNRFERKHPGWDRNDINGVAASWLHEYALAQSKILLNSAYSKFAAIISPSQTPAPSDEIIKHWSGVIQRLEAE